jgi:hypothetical protein
MSAVRRRCSSARQRRGPGCGHGRAAAIGPDTSPFDRERVGRPSLEGTVISTMPQRDVPHDLPSMLEASGEADRGACRSRSRSRSRTAGEGQRYTCMERYHFLPAPVKLPGLPVSFVDRRPPPSRVPAGKTDVQITAALPKRRPALRSHAPACRSRALPQPPHRRPERLRRR